MKKVEAIIKPYKLDEVKTALREVHGDVIAAAILTGLVEQKALILGGFTRAQADEIATALNGK